MLFNTLPFAAFFIATFVIYYLPFTKRHQVLILILASFVFYAWTSPILLLLLLVSGTINATSSYKVSRSDHKTAYQWASLGVIANLGILGFFKYGSLISNTAQQVLFHEVRSPVNIPLPIGISFYTFEGISLVVDCWRQRKDPSITIPRSATIGGHLQNTFLFIVFFPHLIAGPILKARQFLPQIAVKHLADIKWTVAIRCLLVGFFLKTVCADNLKDHTFFIHYPEFEVLSSGTALVLLFGYAMQIFSDFAGYSLIAIGLAKLFGYDFPPNFNFPYLSKTLAEFWSRWHMSLGTWLRDYLYIPLGGNRLGKNRTLLNLLIVMTLGGMWHGAAWSYLIWGFYHGAGLVVERLLMPNGLPNNDRPAANAKELILNSVHVTLVFVFVCCGWLLFKLPDITQVAGFITTVLHNWRSGLDITRVAPTLIYSLPVIFYYWWALPRVRQWRSSGPSSTKLAFRVLETAALGVAVFSLFNAAGSVGEFIYFQF
jgi:alginate O-acetyltransferase complex protein AlgI